MLKRMLLADVLIFAIAVSFAAQICVFNAALKENAVGLAYGADIPLSGVSVSATRAYGGEGSGDATTNSSGHYSMTESLLPGTYNVTAFEEGYIDAETDLVNVVAGQTTPNINFDLQASGGVSGTVVDAVTSNPINATEVYIHLANGTAGYSWFATTGADGKYFAATNLPTGRYNVTVSLPPHGYISNSTQADVIAGVETENVNLQLPKSGIISGRVTAPNSTGLPGVSVSTYSSTYTYSGYSTTDSNGNYTIDTGLGTDTYTVTAGGFGNYTTYGGLIPSPVTVTAGQTTSGIDIELTPVSSGPTGSGMITGHVKNQSNNPIQYAQVTASGTHGYGFAETDANGFYNISSSLETGNDYNITVQASGYYDTYYSSLVSVTIGQTTPNIDNQMTAIPLSACGTITGTVTGGSTPIIPEFQTPLIAMLSLMLATAVAGRTLLRTRRIKSRNTP